MPFSRLEAKSTIIKPFPHSEAKAVFIETNQRDEDNVETMEGDLLDVMTVREHLAEKVETGPLAVKMVEDHPAVMAATEEMKAAMRTEAHTVKNAQNVGRRNLEHLENHVAMAQVMHIIDLQNQSADVKMTTREGQQWVPNITTSMP